MSEVDNLLKKAQDYKKLEVVLNRAYKQASTGKGFDRHSNGLCFEKQPMQVISELIGDHHGLLFQAVKKIQESVRMDRDKAVHELLGAINYIAGSVIFLERE